MAGNEAVNRRSFVKLLFSLELISGAIDLVRVERWSLRWLDYYFLVFEGTFWNVIGIVINH